MTQPICRRCLISEFDIKKEFRYIYEYIDQMPEDLKADPETYAERLEICKTCDSLLSGLCLKCGCYVEIRAAKKEGYCPSEKHFW